MTEIVRDEKHQYTVDGEKYAGVTTVISIIDKSGPLIPWAVKQTCDYIHNRLTEGDMTINEVIALARKEATRQKEEAGAIGTTVHGMVEAWAKDPFAEPPTASQYANTAILRAYYTFLEWAESVSLHPVQSELMVANAKYRYAGTLDLVADIRCEGWRKPRRYLIDVKTSNGFYKDSMVPQLAAYANCLEVPPQGIGVIRIDKRDGKPYWHDCTDDWAWGWKTFKAARELYKLVRGK
jgi:hypothetical protein